MAQALVIPGYDLLTRLGGGQITSVYSARERDTDSACALKVLRGDWADQSIAVKLLQREARAALAVRHPHVVAVRKAHVMKPPHYLAMDFLTGESLRQRLRRNFSLPVSEALWIARQVAEALAALHAKGFIHGDIKPDNIFLTADGRAVLLDLGFAHRPGENVAIFQQGYILGTVEYLAPEMCAAEPRDDLAADMFSFGVTVFEMLCGRLPYPRGSVRHTIDRHINGHPADLRQFTRNLPPALVKMTAKLLARQPEQRPRPLAIVQQLVALEIATMQHRQAA